MITDSSINASVNLASKFAKKGLLLSPITSTPISQLVNASYFPTPTGEFLQMDIDDKLKKGSTHRSPDGVCHHDLVMDEVVEPIVKVIKLNLDLARNRVNPIIRDVVECTQKELDNMESVGAPRVSIVPQNYHSVWSNNLLLELVERFEEAPVNDQAMNVLVPMPETYEALTGLLKTGIARLDREVEDLLSSLPEEFVKYTYTSAFGDPISSDGNQSLINLVSHFGNSQMMASSILLLHLFARGLSNSVPENINMSLPEFKAYLATVIEQSGRAINRVMQKRVKEKNRKVLIYDYPLEGSLVGSVDTTVRVNGDIYNDWLQDGGEPEVILGALVGDRETGYQGLIDRKDQYKALWVKHERTLKLRIVNDRQNNALEALKRSLLKVVSELDEEIKFADVAVYRQRIVDATVKLSGMWFEDIYRTVRKVVCEVMFPHTDALKVLCALDEAAEANPDLDIREAGHLAVINIVAEWVAQLIDVTSVPQE
jgi:hypothetical protein